MKVWFDRLFRDFETGPFSKEIKFINSPITRPHPSCDRRRVNDGRRLALSQVGIARPHRARRKVICAASAKARRLSRATMRNIRQNFFLPFSTVHRPVSHSTL